MIVPLLNLVDTIFQLHDRGWIRYLHQFIVLLGASLSINFVIRLTDAAYESFNDKLLWIVFQATGSMAGETDSAVGNGRCH